MNVLYLQASRTTPEVRLNTDEKSMYLIGRSNPENALAFYQQVYSSIDDYFKDSETLKVNMLFEYFNTSSSKCLFGLFKQVQKYRDQGKRVIVNWYYEEDDEDMLETGEDFSDVLDLDFDLLEIPEGQDINSVVSHT